MLLKFRVLQRNDERWVVMATTDHENDVVTVHLAHEDGRKADYTMGREAFEELPIVEFYSKE